MMLNALHDTHATHAAIAQAIADPAQRPERQTYERLVGHHRPGLSSRNAEGDCASHPDQRPGQVLAVLFLAAFLVRPRPDARRSSASRVDARHDASPAAASWVLTGFLLSASIATPIVGKLGDLFGKGRVLTGVMLVFALGAVVNALAASIGVVIAGRVLQGVAGWRLPALLRGRCATPSRAQVPAGIALSARSFGIGGGIGLPLTGVIVDNFDVSGCSGSTSSRCRSRSPPTG